MNNIREMKLGMITVLTGLIMLMLYLMMAFSSSSITVNEQTLIRTGAILPSSVYQNEIYRYFVAHLLPRNILDLLVIVLLLIPVLNQVEIELKKSKFLLLLLSIMVITGIINSLFINSAYSGYYSLLYGFIGVMYGFGRKNPVYRIIVNSYAVIIIFSFVISLISGSTSQVIILSVALIVGFILGLIFYNPKKRGA